MKNRFKTRRKRRSCCIFIIQYFDTFMCDMCGEAHVKLCNKEDGGRTEAFTSHKEVDRSGEGA